MTLTIHGGTEKMKKFEGVVLIVDFDGTLSSHGAISQENCDAIRYFQENGGLFTIASGRNPGWVGKWKDYVVPNTFLSLVNGAILCTPDEKEIVFEAFSGDALLEMIPRVFEACPFLDGADHNFRTGYYRQKPGEEIPQELRQIPIYKSIYKTPSEYSDEYAARIKEIAGDEFIVMRSWINGIEVQRKGTGKGDSVHRYKELLGDRARLVVGAGNYENDLDLIVEADIGYAVGDSIETLKAVADRVTVNHDQHAIAAIIADLEKELPLRS